MRILALDTSNDVCSVALLNQGLSKSIFEYSPRQHAKKLLLMIKQILVNNNVSLHQLDVLAYSRGPGSFTGLRVGLSVAKGLAFGANISMIGISNLASIAEKAFRLSGTKQVLVALYANKDEIYWGEYQKKNNSLWEGEETERILKVQDVKNRIAATTSSFSTWIKAGPGWKRYTDLIDEVKKMNSLLYTNTNAQDILPLAIKYVMEGKTVSADFFVVEPEYMHNHLKWKKISGRF
ncbi:MAG: tRNA (adenosine(37)-N6)-threonylcarbamoyltransferase complex dimerization subunit type 1 TsaB [Candidatus Dasytiphilus stammeri]